MDEETRKLISYGFALAREVEFNVPDLVTRPDILSASCDEIARVFTLCRRRLSPSSLPLDDAERKAMDVPDSTRGFSASSSKGGTTRKGEGENTTVITVPATGNTELPPDDGYTWRKYGQKEILGNNYPRSYYRCSNQKLYGCPARKQVQRLNEDPYTFEVTYRSIHTCHVSSAAILGPHSQQSLSSATTTSFPEFPLPVADMADVMFNSGTDMSSNSMDLIFPPIDENEQ